MLTVVGAGRVGQALAAAATAQGIEVQVVTRGGAVPDGAGPVLVCTRNDDVAGVIDACPRPADLVLVQNGALLPWLRGRGFGELTQGQLWFAVPTRGAPPEAGAPSVFWGRHASWTAAFLGRAGLATRTVASAAQYEAEVGTKLLWLSVFGVLGDLHQETVLASLARTDEFEARVAELLPVCGAGLGATPDAADTLRRLREYSLAVGSWRAAVKEWPWRDGWLHTVARRAGLATPLHDEACARLGHPAGPVGLY